MKAMGPEELSPNCGGSFAYIEIIRMSSAQLQCIKSCKHIQGKLHLHTPNRNAEPEGPSLQQYNLGSGSRASPLKHHSRGLPGQCLQCPSLKSALCLQMVLVKKNKYCLKRQHSQSLLILSHKPTWATHHTCSESKQQTTAGARTSTQHSCSSWLLDPHSWSLLFLVTPPSLPLPHLLSGISPLFWFCLPLSPGSTHRPWGLYHT